MSDKKKLPRDEVIDRQKDRARELINPENPDEDPRGGMAEYGAPRPPKGWGEDRDLLPKYGGPRPPKGWEEALGEKKKG